MVVCLWISFWKRRQFYKIKLLKRVSYGYSSFSNFRLHILIMSRLFVSEYKNNINLKESKKKFKQQNTA